MTHTTGRIINGRVTIVTRHYTDKGVTVAVYTPCHGTERETIGQAAALAAVKCRTSGRKEG